MASLINVPMAAVVWTTLFRVWPHLPLGLWITGALLAGLSGALFSLDGRAPIWLTNDLAVAALGPAFALRIAALRLDLGWPTRAMALTLLALAPYAMHAVVLHGGQWLGLELARPIAMVWPHLLGAAWSFAFAWHSMQVGRQFASRSGWLLGTAEFVFGLTLLLRGLAMVLGWIEWRMFSNDWPTRLIEISGFIAVLYSNLGYIGMVLDRSTEAARLSGESELSEKLRREAAEQRALELRQLLAERSQVLHTLAHEIRQPLHNAGGALQAATRALHTSSVAPGPADEALQRAQAVLRHVQSVLDNTLASAKLFARDAAPDLADTDVDLLVHLTLGDLSAEGRARVSLDWQTTLRSVELEPSLVRLALRNLLNNAIEHGGANVQVKLVIAEQSAPPALLLRVLDDGPALAPDVLQRLQSVPAAAANAPIARLAQTHPSHPSAAATTPAASDTFGRGLGLALARRVMQLHGGELRIAPAPLHGLDACLVFPLPDE